LDIPESRLKNLSDVLPHLLTPIHIYVYS
jgi:hypothetical protein